MSKAKRWYMTYTGLMLFGTGVSVVVGIDGHWMGFMAMAAGAYMISEVAAHGPTEPTQ